MIIACKIGMIIVTMKRGCANIRKLGASQFSLARNDRGRQLTMISTLKRDFNGDFMVTSWDFLEFDEDCSLDILDF